MKILSYIGRHTRGVHLVMPNGTEQYVAHGGQVEVDDDHAARLLEQVENWIEAKAGKDEKPDPKPKPSAKEKPEPPVTADDTPAV